MIQKPSPLFVNTPPSRTEKDTPLSTVTTDETAKVSETKKTQAAHDISSISRAVVNFNETSTPEYIYAVGTERDLGLLATMPNAFIEIPVPNQTHIKPNSSNENEILLTFRNNGRVSLREREEFTYCELENLLRDMAGPEKAHAVTQKDVGEMHSLIKVLDPYQKRHFDSVLAQKVDLSKYRKDEITNFLITH